MKRLVYIFLFLPLLMACSNEDEQLAGEGTLVINDVRCEQVTSAVVKTRSLVDNDLALEILDASGNVYRGMQYAAGATLPSTFSLIVANYTLHAYTENQTTWTTDNGGKGSAVYEAEQQFSVVADWVTYVNMEVPMTNYGVAYTLPDNFSTWFPTCEFTVSSGGRTCELSTDETAYFDPSDAKFTYSIHLVNSDGEVYNIDAQTYSNPKAGRIYSINLDFASDDDPTTLKIGISYDDTYEEIVSEITLY